MKTYVNFKNFENFRSLWMVLIRWRISFVSGVSGQSASEADGSLYPSAPSGAFVPKAMARFCRGSIFAKFGRAPYCLVAVSIIFRKYRAVHSSWVKLTLAALMCFTAVLKAFYGLESPVLQLFFKPCFQIVKQVEWVISQDG